ncbi:hypothetical protein DRW07_03375 [Alteromonas sediminis]|uniref:Uncharacterized protein n=1 Tax=Alteromonas sediminis TaxID=2259342 RepID=A0A3N5Y4I0_9ALTE|nr:hypothetical protein [Alteromonas sediminis]RPJ68460.1 hypothetical protein DRW07_03375 [Alteromonas sediminis]
MLKAYAVALALTTNPVAVTEDGVQAKAQDNQAQQTAIKKGWKRGGVIRLPSQELEAKKGWKRGGVIRLPQ